MPEIAHSTNRNTPTVTVMDNRVRNVKDITYYRHSNALTFTDSRELRREHDSRSHLTAVADARLHARGISNFSYQADLLGRFVRARSVDVGTSLFLRDTANRELMNVAGIVSADGVADDYSQAISSLWHYESPARCGRLQTISERYHGESPRRTERFFYAGNTQQEKDRNRAGYCASHYDAAGLKTTECAALSGPPLSITRRILKGIESSDSLADWQSSDPEDLNKDLADELYTTLTTTDALGTALITIDAAGNRQRVIHDKGGRILSRWLTIGTGKETAVTHTVTYTAAGLKNCEVHGNRATCTYFYEPFTQRISGIRVNREAGKASGTLMLQNLRYTYDPVGNVIKSTNDAEQTRYWGNQKVPAENVYRYDSLYQLTQASGREMASATRLYNFSRLNDVTYANYSRTYDYDSVGNLTQIRHCALLSQNSFTTVITISDRSNRGVPSSITEDPAMVEASFTGSGQQKQLEPGLALRWNRQGTLEKVEFLTSNGAPVSEEHYRYAAGNQRLMKFSTSTPSSGIQTRKVLYLPGLELRTTLEGGNEKQRLHVLCVGEPEQVQVHVLNWVQCKPSELENNLLRYSYSNLTGSCELELDGDGRIISKEEYFPYGGTAVWAARHMQEAEYKSLRYSGKELDASGLYYYGARYYQPQAGRWLSADPAGRVDGENLFRFCRNNPVTLRDPDGCQPVNVNADEPTATSSTTGPVTFAPPAGGGMTHFYRVDLSPPSAVLADGFTGNDSMRIVKLFGHDTIFAAATLTGIDKFRAEINSTQNIFGSDRKYYFEQKLNPTTGYFQEVQKPLYLYEITQPQTIPYDYYLLSDFFLREDAAESAFLATPDEIHPRDILERYGKAVYDHNLNEFKATLKGYATNYNSTTEVQIRGPISASHIRYINPAQETAMRIQQRLAA